MNGINKIKLIAAKKINVLIILLVIVVMHSCNQSPEKTRMHGTDTANEQRQIAVMLDSFNIAAAKADFNKYFGYYTTDAIFTGTDATERWDKKQFMAYAKPYFDRGHAWNFKSIERHIYFDKTGTLAWFDELLNTQMKICRGSGVVSKEGNEWKIRQYILSATIPNELMDSITKMKGPAEDVLIKKSK